MAGGSQGKYGSKPQQRSSRPELQSRSDSGQEQHKSNSGFVALVVAIKDSMLAKISVALLAGLGTVAYVTYGTIWNENIRPRLDQFVMNEINDYFSGALEKRTQNLQGKRNDSELDKFLAEKISEYNSGKFIRGSGAARAKSIEQKFAELSKAIFTDVDSVYTIDVEYNLNQATAIKPTKLYLYADPDRHNVKAVIYTRGMIPVANEKLQFLFDLYVNTHRIGPAVPNIDADITKEFFKHPLQGSGGSGRDDDNNSALAMKYPHAIQLVEIRPHIPQLPRPTEPALASLSNKTMPVEPTVSIYGYILVTRKGSPSSGTELQ